MADYVKEKIRNALKGRMPKFIPCNIGRIFTDEHRKNLSDSHKGIKPGNYKENLIQCSYCGRIFHKKISHLTRRNFCSKLCFYAWRKTCDVEGLDRLRRRGIARDRGLTQGRERIKQLAIYKDWRRGVLTRDNYTCQACGLRGGSLQAHHIKPFSSFPKLRFDISNGQTLCRACHKKTDNYGKNRIYLEDTCVKK